MMVVSLYTPAAIPVADELEAWLKELGLCDSFKLAGALMLEPQSRAVTEEIKKWIKTLGVKEAFKLNGTLILYSGPQKSLQTYIAKLYGKPHAKNHGRAFSIIRGGDYAMLDRSKVGKRLTKYNKIGIFSHLNSIFITEKFDLDIIEDQREIAQKQIDIVMGFASAALAFVAKGDVETVVCGADPEKVFMLFELPALMANSNIKNINGVPADDFRKIYYSGDKDAVYQTFQKVSESEVAFLHERAEASGMRKNARPWMRHKIQNDLWQQEKRLHVPAVA